MYEMTVEVILPMGANEPTWFMGLQKGKEWCEGIWSKLILISVEKKDTTPLCQSQKTEKFF